MSIVNWILICSLLLMPGKTAPPQITVQPVNVTAAPPAPATFNLVARGSSLTFTGYLNNTVIPCTVTNKTNAACTVSPTTAAMNGDTFHAVVSNGGGNVASGVATLTINPAPPPANVVTIAATFTLPAATSGVAYSANIATLASVTINGTAGCSSCTYAITSGSLTGTSLTLSTTGVLSGTPATVTKSTSFSFTITVTAPATAYRGAGHAKIYATLSIPKPVHSTR